MEFLQAQYSCYSIDTSFFNTPDEQQIYDELVKLRRWKKILSQIKEQMKKNHIKVRGYTGAPDDFGELSAAVDEKYTAILQKYDLTKRITALKEQYIELIQQNDKVRTLDTRCFDEYHKVALFTSTLSRVCGFEKDQTTTDLIIITTYFYDITRQNILYGFYVGDERYIYLYSSAGEIRKHKVVFIRESLYERVAPTLMAGMDVETINAKGGINPSKYLAYCALTSSATEWWNSDKEHCDEIGITPFNIDKCIVVKDFETTVDGTVDFIDDVEYTVTRQEASLPICHSDGAGMILPRCCKRNFMIRLPFIKGALFSFDFAAYCEDIGYSGDVTDIYGKKYNIFDDDIEVIFTESQFKLYKYYESWDDYKQKFKKYKCQAGICNMEPEDGLIPRSMINYQELQTLIDFDDTDLKRLVQTSNNTLKSISHNKNTMLRVFGADAFNHDKDAYQEALSIYPELLTDAYSKHKLHQIKKSLIKKFKAGHLEISGKYTFVSPDLTACCDHWFGGVKHPLGVLQNGEVYCSLYENVEELDCLRSPHLFMEHCVRKNVTNDFIQKYFKTPAIYTSIHDYISRVLQFDEQHRRTLWKHKDIKLREPTHVGCTL